MGSNRGQLKAGDRPLIKTTVHRLLQEMISKGWNPQPDKRPTFEGMWKKLHELEFKIFPKVEVQFFSET
jgi:hypothetical protein